MKLEIKQYINHCGVIQPYIDFEKDRYWYFSGGGRTVKFASNTTSKIISGLVYPYYHRVYDPKAILHVKD